MDAFQKERKNWPVPAIAVVVIAVAVVAVLYPMLHRTMEGTRRDTCLTDLKHCAMALGLYCSYYDGTMPSSAVVGHSAKWSKRDFLTFGTRIGKLPPYPKKPMNTWPQVLYAHVGTKSITFCVTDPVDREKPGSYVSYWWKLAIDKAWYGEGCSRAYRKLEDFQRAADQVFLYEHQPFHFGIGGGLRNGAHINVVFLDTHVDTIELVNATSGDPVNCAANSDGEPMYFNFDNSRPKGTGNPRPARIPATYIDPGKYSDHLP